MDYLKDEFAYLQRIWRETKPIFPRILLADLLFKLLALLALSPIIGWLFNRLVQSSGSSAVSNLDIVSFMLSPTVLFGLVLVLILGVALAYAESITLMFTAFAHRRGEPLTFRHIVQQVSTQFVDLLGLGLMVFGRVLLTLAPTLILSLLAYLLVFSEHDVNYYI